MKTAIALVVTAVVSIAATCFLLAGHLARRHAEQLARQQAAWLTEKADLESALLARQQLQPAPEPAPVPVPVVLVTNRIAPEAILQKLTALRISPGSDRSKNIRQAIRLFEELIEAGPAALPAIGAFLDRFEDTSYDAEADGLRRALKEGRLTTDFVLPPSLRLGLFDVARQIGGPEAEQILARSLESTGRGVEVAYLAKALQELAPDRYRDAALAAARELLVNPAPNAQPDRLDKGSRDFLFAVLGMFGDTSFAAAAQSQLLRADGEIDHSALRYLKSTLGEQALPAIQQALYDARLREPEQKEALLHFISSYVGQNRQANELVQSVILDESLPIELRVNSLSSLYKVGFNEDQPGPGDRQLAQARLGVLKDLLPALNDNKLVRHAEEVAHGLAELLERPAQPKPPKKP